MHARTRRSRLFYRGLELVARRAEPRLRAKLHQQSRGRPCSRGPAGEAVQERLEPWPIDLLAQSLRGRLLQVMGLIDDQVVVVGKQPASHLGISEQKRVVDDDEVRRLRLGASPMHVAVLRGATHTDAVERVGRDVRPQHLFTTLQAQL